MFHTVKVHSHERQRLRVRLRFRQITNIVSMRMLRQTQRMARSTQRMPILCV